MSEEKKAKLKEIRKAFEDFRENGKKAIDMVDINTPRDVLLQIASEQREGCAKLLQMVLNSDAFDKCTLGDERPIFVKTGTAYKRMTRVSQKEYDVIAEMSKSSDFLKGILDTLSIIDDIPSESVEINNDNK